MNKLIIIIVIIVVLFCLICCTWNKLNGGHGTYGLRANLNQIDYSHYKNTNINDSYFSQISKDIYIKLLFVDTFNNFGFNSYIETDKKVSNQIVTLNYPEFINIINTNKLNYVYTLESNENFTSHHWYKSLISDMFNIYSIKTYYRSNIKAGSIQVSYTNTNINTNDSKINTTLFSNNGEPLSIDDGNFLVNNFTSINKYIHGKQQYNTYYVYNMFLDTNRNYLCNFRNQSIQYEELNVLSLDLNDRANNNTFYKNMNINCDIEIKLTDDCGTIFKNLFEFYLMQKIFYENYYLNKSYIGFKYKMIGNNFYEYTLSNTTAIDTTSPYFQLFKEFLVYYNPIDNENYYGFTDYGCYDISYPKGNTLIPYNNTHGYTFKLNLNYINEHIKEIFKDKDSCKNPDAIAYKTLN
jgi:hypothetical protein